MIIGYTLMLISLCNIQINEFVHTSTTEGTKIVASHTWFIMDSTGMPPRKQIGI